MSLCFSLSHVHSLAAVAEFARGGGLRSGTGHRQGVGKGGMFLQMHHVWGVAPFLNSESCFKGRTSEWFGLEGTSKLLQSNPPTVSRDTFH